MAIVKFKCKKCASEKGKSKLASIPMKINNKTLVIERVAVKECLDCNELHPSAAGEEKIQRGLESYARLLGLGNVSQGY